MNKLKKKARAIARRSVIAMYRSLAPMIPVDRDMIVFDSSQGRNYSGSPRAIYEEMVSKGLDKEFRCVWFFKKGCRPEHLPGKCEVETYAGAKYLLAMAKAKYWIFDARNPYFLVKKKNQVYIQTWHGTPLKKLGLDMERVDLPNVKSLEDYHEKILINSRSWDYLIAQNDFSAKIFRRCFGFEGEMLRIGYPRNDVLFQRNKPEEIAKIKEELGIPKDKKVLLYAPTFRDTQHNAKGEYYFDLALDLDLMKEKLGNEYILITKLHYLVSEKIDLSRYKGFVYPSPTDEISLLYLIADAMITDYSSVMFDYTLLKRPVYFFCYDLEEYGDVLRGFYFDFVKEAPGPIAKTTEELIGNILTEKEKEYTEQKEAFYRKFHEYDHGNASEKVLEIIFSHKNK